VEITAPWGYGEIVPLEKEHRVLLPAGNTPIFCRHLNAIAVSIAEFVAAGRDYPVAFLRGASGGFAPVAVLGLTDAANLYVDRAGEWERGAYVPAYVRRFPFCLSRVTVDGKPRGERLVCVARDYVDRAGVPMFERGRPTAHWRAIEKLLQEFEDDLERTARFGAALARLKLLEPMSVQLKGRPQVRLGGMHRVAVEKLKALRPASLKALLEKDFLAAIFAHLHSLQNFSRLAARLPAAGRG
jgi:hypothetical protein